MQKKTSAGARARLRLDDVTVIVADCIHPELAARALGICRDKADFADAILFSDKPVEGPFRWQAIPPIASLGDYSRFIMHELPAHIASEFVLVVQWDGYVLDPAAWKPGFLRYDYVGAPYFNNDGDGWVVGNGGFSLRSRRLLSAVAKLPIVPNLNEDGLICQVFRETLERDHGIRFAGIDAANRFSFEQRRPEKRTFGFHGVFNLHRVESDAEVMQMVSALTPAELTDGRLFALMNQCLYDSRLELAARLFERVRQAASSDTIRAVVFRLYGPGELSLRLINQLEALARGSNVA